ncbi:WXG superfamily protein probably secreted by type VII secretion system [Ureibacillus acetophenoni]|uniref:WXG superfamily protein probably secreted by type VII secretion system n=1 Tax=Ureibacillus acetophenoni TaxID=614649 RepID=A0A285UU08_9BACL|nr:WXG superfamily protein probably secreted by type VII secretion system [Ureibacillus acetophenoni]
MIEALNTLEPDQSGYIDQSYLESEVEQGLDNAKEVAETLTSETNSIMGEVSDIVSLPNLDDSEVQTENQNAKRHRDTTVTDQTLEKYGFHVVDHLFFAILSDPTAKIMTAEIFRPIEENDF